MMAYGWSVLLLFWYVDAGFIGDRKDNAIMSEVSNSQVV